MKISIQTEQSAVVASTIKILGRILKERTGLEPVFDSARPDLVLALDEKLPKEGYALSDHGRGVCVTGGDPNGLLYGAGAWLRGLKYGQGSFAHGPWRGISSPATPLRGMYFATHFGNYYDEAPLEEIEHCLENLALWGCNSLAVWFDMHRFKGISEPAAQNTIKRLRHILACAGNLGMSAALVSLANEAYADSPVDLRADWTSGHDGYLHDLCGHYHVELCPNRPGAMETLMRWRGEVLDAFAGINVEYVMFCGYDQGGCTCPRCAPWGANGMLKIAKEYSKLARKKFPGCKVMMSGWRFDIFTRGEWAGLRCAFAKGQNYVDMLHIDLGDMDKVLPDAPGGLPVVGMPEISMHAMLPWGGYGANPIPENLQAFWDKAKLLAGTYPYSEGIYEDMNKAIILQLEWDPSIAAMAAVREYASFYFGMDAATDVCRAVEILEKNVSHNAVTIQEGLNHSAYDLNKTRADKPWELRHKANLPADAGKCLALLEGVAPKLPEWAANSWQWKIILARAVIDAEIARHSGDSTPKMEECLHALQLLYHTDVNRTIPCLMPPGLPAWEKLIRKNIDGRI